MADTPPVRAPRRGVLASNDVRLGSGLLCWYSLHLAVSWVLLGEGLWYRWGMMDVSSIKVESWSERLRGF